MGEVDPAGCSCNDVRSHGARGSADSSSRSVGLGLFIVRAIAQAHQGDVTVASSTQTGTQFTVKFPAASTEQ